MEKTGNLDGRAWMRLPSGKRLDLINPDPLGWDDADLCTRLARTSRWGGESCWPLPLSVAQHSLLVLEIRRAVARAPLTCEQALRELLHDAEEAFLGFDCISPLKRILGEPFRRIEGSLSAAVWERYRVLAWTEHDYRLHKSADHIAAACEAVHCVGWGRQEVVDVLGISATVLEDDPLQARYGGTSWEPWTADVAAARFQDALIGLLVQREALRSGFIR